ncbi:MULTISPECIES: hypothetical protein [Pseudomonas]|uniref:hypothetical protein n=1 Tax=Pseudomonas TaxID=286 RepID=UPI00223211B3|nr:MULTISPECIES: hypothetical protein [Pseudomonas]MDN3222570.1 hypothetical protein [Pseudomonas nunensis]UZE13508.1 hypothetical protein LOY68_07830 [Pseudomonas sp. B21-053]
MIETAEEFVALRSSQIKDEYDRAAMEEAPISVWREVISEYPDYRKWVAHNKTVPLEILEELCVFSSDVRRFIASKRKLSLKLFELLSNDLDADVRVEIAANNKAPRTVLESLLMDADEDVVSAAKNNLERRGYAR